MYCKRRWYSWRFIQYTSRSFLIICLVHRFHSLAKMLPLASCHQNKGTRSLVPVRSNWALKAETDLCHWGNKERRLDANKLYGLLSVAIDSEPVQHQTWISPSREWSYPDFDLPLYKGGSLRSFEQTIRSIPRNSPPLELHSVAAA
jgi:hypothetical protein